MGLMVESELVIETWATTMGKKFFLIEVAEKWKSERWHMPGLLDDPRSSCSLRSSFSLYMIYSNPSLLCSSFQCVFWKIPSLCRFICNTISNFQNSVWERLVLYNRTRTLLVMKSLYLRSMISIRAGRPAWCWDMVPFQVLGWERATIIPTSW